jgi:choline dehydrogenase-like flavoprotein
MYGAGFYQVTCRDGRRRSAAVSYLHPVSRRPNLTVKTHARVLRLLIEGGRAVGVEVAKGRGRGTLRASREVIVSAGAINSPRLLMLSGIGPADELKALGIAPVADLKGVGRNLQDHLCTNVHSTLKQPISYDRQDRYPKALLHGIRWLLYRNGPAAAVIVEGGGFFQTEGASRPDLQIHIAPAMVVRGGQTPLDGHGFTINSTFLRPKSIGSVRLRSSDPADEPLVDPNYLDDPYDRAMALKSVRIIREVLAQSEIARFIKVERLPGTDARSDDEIMAYIRQYACCDYHPVGTCKMGIDDMAVVDPELKVRGIETLRVIDSSIMPVLISGNTNGPTMMIAEKGADLVKGVRAASPRRAMAAVA